MSIPAYGTTINWKVSLQKVVTFSTIEPEYIAMTKVVEEALWLKDLVKKLKLQDQIVTIYCENRNAIQLSRTKSTMKELSTLMLSCIS